MPQDAPLEVPAAAMGVDQSALGVARHRVDGQVAPAQVLFERDVRTGIDGKAAIALASLRLPPRQGVFLTASLLTSFATNNVAAVLVFPICIQIATAVDSNPEPFLITLMVAASASFATPIGYQTNLMVYGPGNYRFVDYLKLGLPLNLMVIAAGTLLIPRFWPF